MRFANGRYDKFTLRHSPELLTRRFAAVDVWSAGVILLFFLTGKFPIFQSNDDVEGLMELALIMGRRNVEKVATLHGRFTAPWIIFCILQIC